MKKWLLTLLMCAVASTATAVDELSSGQALYLPIYSQIWHGDLAGTLPKKSLISALVSIRNTSLKTPIRITSARYYSTEGRLIREYVPKPVVIAAMATTELFVERMEAEGGSGANFIIQWDSAAATNPPVVEAVHADVKNGSHALIFISQARPIRPDK